MALSTEIYERIASYLSGDMQDSEMRLLEEWRAASSENEAAFKEAVKIWERSGTKLKDESIDTDQEWNRLLSELESQTSTKTVVLKPAYSLWMKVAATVTLLAIALVWFLNTNKGDSLYAKDSVITAYLPDSTKVWLNTGSKLSYSKDFNNTIREVTLEGEGFFKVKRDTEKPFIVTTSNSVTRVLGTSFNVKESGAKTELNVVEGTVRFSAVDTVSARGAVIVKQNEAATLEGKNKPEKFRSKTSDFAAWRLKNNPAYEHEKKQPQSYLKPVFNWRKNAINQSVIQGQIESSADLATFKNIVMRVHYTRANGTISSTRVTVAETIRPGSTISFEKRLLDIFSDTKSLRIEVESAESIEPESK